MQNLMLLLEPRKFQAFLPCHEGSSVSNSIEITICYQYSEGTVLRNVERLGKDWMLNLTLNLRELKI